MSTIYWALITFQRPVRTRAEFLSKCSMELAFPNLKTVKPFAKLLLFEESIKKQTTKNDVGRINPLNAEN